MNIGILQLHKIMIYVSIKLELIGQLKRSVIEFNIEFNLSVILIVASRETKTNINLAIKKL